jgi:hypothetical protein
LPMQATIMQKGLLKKPMELLYSLLTEYFFMILSVGYLLTFSENPTFGFQQI